MKLLFVILVYMFILHTEISTDDVLVMDPRGYCPVMVSSRKSRLISYMETYRERTWGIFFKTKYRWNYRTEYYTTWATEKRCCLFYKKYLDMCVPDCDRECGNGTCIPPNICACYLGYMESSLYDGPKCVPECNNPCIHGQCTAPNTCTCDKGYQLLSNKFICEPVCEPNCDSETSICTAPNTCSCRDGYKKSGLKTCTPICIVGCRNGTCTAPDTCTCNKGYTLDPDNRFVCKPVCNKCIDGTCTAPGVCTCDKGYSLSNESVCKPVCSDGCHMGTCIAPGICMCHRGYGFSSYSMSVCVPICPKACINGVCVKPEICECHEGFEVTGDETSLHVCKPHCDISCGPNGNCTAPNVCTCNKGYSLREKNDDSIWFDGQSVCKPICEKECINGYCAAPGICNCWIGYERSDDVHICKPVCEPPCWPNSTCTRPNQCTCNYGYQLKVNSENAKSTCEPICEQECINGFCSKPDECSCNSGYFEFEVNNCFPVCEPSCWTYSTCTEPGVCTCNEGYDLIIMQNNSSKCEPICMPACPSNSICKSPGLCLCKEGYHLIENNENTICEPICEFSCINGTCSSPNTCTCDLGYVNDENGSCIPHCMNDCGNGTCVEPNVCICDEGYALVNGSLACEPYCENNCDNGDCVAPDDCRCHAGFFKNGNESDSICVKACKNGCNEKGDCIDDQDTCNCYFGWRGTICKEPTVCVVIVLEEYQIYETLSLMQMPNNSMIFASASNPTCQQCLDQVNNETICYESLNDNIEDRNNSVICFVDANSMCFKAQSLTGEVVKVSIAVGGVAVLIMVLSIVVACLKCRKNKRQLDIGKQS